MNKKICTHGFLLIAVCASVSVNAARPSINVLNTRVNQLEAENAQQDARISELEAQSKVPVVVDGGRNELGTALGVYFDRSTEYGVDILTSEGYVVRVNYNGTISNDMTIFQPIYYLTPDCTGQAYIETHGLGSLAFSDYSYSFGLWYVPRDSRSVSIIAQSYDNGAATCISSVSETVNNVLPININDPGVTGVPLLQLQNGRRLYRGPLRLEKQ